MDKLYEIRDPIHGLVQFNDLEREIINSPAFQRLRRVKQLAWTDYVYPGAVHNRFEHSIGVMHLAGRLFDALLRDERSKLIASGHFKLAEDEIQRQRQSVRIAALTHDLGHGPFSHAAEALYPRVSDSDSRRVPHEEYSACLIRDQISEILKNHRTSNTLGLDADEVASFISGTPKDAKVALFKSLISGALDADRMDYLLRDAYHCGVRYGQYDLERVINTVGICEDEEEDGDFHIGINLDGLHAAEGLLIARYMMFTQVYLHKTRVIYDYHIENALSYVLGENGGVFPDARVKDGRIEFLKWDDWKVLGLLAEQKAGPHGELIAKRNHFRLVYETEEAPDGQTSIEKVERRFARVKEALSGLECVERKVEANWYKQGIRNEVLVRGVDDKSCKGTQLSMLSNVVKSLKPVNQRRLYVSAENSDSAKNCIEKLKL